MSPAALPPSSYTICTPANTQQETERRTRAERLDYRALHNGRAHEQPSRSHSNTKSDSEIMAKGGAASSLSAAARVSQSAQRSALREQKLRADPNVEVLGPVDVRCKRCGTHIKLSMKSTYDPFHWQRHIERCTKRPMSAIKQGMAAGKFAERKKRSTVSKNTQASSELRSTRGLRSRKKDADSTPALTPDKDIIIVKEESPETELLSSSPPPELTPPPETPKSTPVREPDIVLEEYYKRSRRRLTRELSPITPESLRTWSWSQLKEATWVVATYPPDHGAAKTANTMGGSFDSFRVSPQPSEPLPRP